MRCFEIFERRMDVQANSNCPPGIQSEGAEHELEPYQQKAEKNIIDKIFSSSSYKRKRVLEKNKIDKDDIDRPPDIIEDSRNNCAGISSRINQYPQKHIGETYPYVEHKLPSIDLNRHLFYSAINVGKSFSSATLINLLFVYDKPSFVDEVYE